jgi:hypothetical protein
LIERELAPERVRGRGPRVPSTEASLTITLALSLAAVLLTSQVLASDDAVLAPDQRVRVTLREDGTEVGVLRSATAATLTMAAGGREVAIPVDDIVGVDVSEGRRDKRGKYALLGALPWIAAVTATLIDGGADESGIVSLPSALLLGGGLAAGYVVGSTRSTETWRSVPLPRSEGSRSLNPAINLAFRWRF